jgi:hypothetical protein
MIPWSAFSIGKRVLLSGVLAVPVLLLTGTPVNGQAATAPANPAGTAKKTIQGAQERLLALGYQPGAADGVMGPKAVAALEKFQADRGLPVTGQLDRKTLNALGADGAKAPNSDANKNAAAEEKYEPAYGLDMDFEPAISSITREGRMTDADAAAGHIVPGFDVTSVDGVVKKLAVGNTDIELASDKLGADQGFLTVETKKYGTFRFEFATADSLTLWLKPSQKMALLELLK